MAGSYSQAGGVRTLSLGGRSLLFVEDRQQLLELNETADRIWRALAGAATVSAAAHGLAKLGLSPEQASQLVEDAAAEWTAAGFLTPGSLNRLLERGASRTLVLDELVVDLHLGELRCEELDAAFGHFYASGEGASGRRRLAILEHAGQLLFYVDRRLVLAGRGDGLVAHVKAVLTDLYADAVEDGYLVHGALLLQGGRRLLLSGEPGAGKTTLALALAAAGWRYGGDDIVRINSAGLAQGVPFAAAVKSGSAPLLREMWPDLTRLRAWVRSDGQQARYLLPANRAAAAPGPLTTVVILARRADAVAATRPISAVDAMIAILQSGYARRWRMTGEALCALAESLDQAVCVQLDYCDLGPAVKALEDIAGVAPQAA